MKGLVAILLLAALPARPATKVLVTVIEQKSGQPVAGLKAQDFTVLEDRAPRRVEAAEYSTGPVDVMLLLDTSLIGAEVQRAAPDLIAQLAAREQMAIVAFHSSADLIQDFTSSQELLKRAVARVKYGNSPRLLDALYAAIDSGFEHASYRRVLLVLTTGVEGPSRMSERDVLRLARRNGVSIYPVYLLGLGRSLFESLARQTGGASFNLRELGRAGAGAERIFQVLRGHYTLTLSGNLSLGEKIKVEVRRAGKTLASALPLE